MPITETMRKALIRKQANMIAIEDPAARREADNALAEEARYNAILEYIVACDYPEVFEDEEEEDE